MSNKITVAAAVYLLMFNEKGQILIALRANTGYQDGNWQVAAGHLEDKELPTQAAVREGGEELGIAINPEDLELVHVSCRPRHDTTGNRMDFFFKVHKWSGEIRRAEPDKCPEIKWVDPNNLPENMTPHVRLGIECAMKGIPFMELSLDWVKSQPLYNIS